MSNPVYRVLEEVEKAASKQDKLYILRSYSNQAVKDVLQGAYDKRIKWALPEGPVPYTPADPAGLEHALARETRKFYLFAEGGHATLHPRRREELFVDFLQSIHPEDAKIICYAKDKKLPYKSITPDLVMEAFPDMGLQPITEEVKADKPSTKSPRARKKVVKEKPVQVAKQPDLEPETKQPTTKAEEFVYEEDPVANALGLIKPESDFVNP